MPTLEKLKDSQDKILVPKCVECGKNIKPHCMFFDESYSQKYYRMDTVKKFIQDADCALICGTSLETLGAQRIVFQILNRNKPVIEMNINEE